VIEPDAGGEGEESGGDTGTESVQAAGVVAFQAEAVFERPEDALDPLTDRRQVRAAAGFDLASWAQHRRAEALRGGPFDVLAGVALVGNDRLAALQAHPPNRLAGGDAIAGAGPARRAGNGTHAFDMWASLRCLGVAKATKNESNLLAWTQVTGPRYGHPLGIRLLDAVAILTTPLLPDDYLGQLNPLWSTREPHGRVEAVVAETRDCVTLWLRPGRGWPAHVPGQYVRVGVDVDGVRHWRTYSLTSLPRRLDGRIAITVKRMPGGLVSQ